jgi:hypothetical protein
MYKEALLAGMLLFRLIYYFFPFVISVLLLAIRVMVLCARDKRRAPGITTTGTPPAADR